MAEVRCPMCGKPNPEDLEVCQYCQARLKPLIISQPPEETPKAPESHPSIDKTPSKPIKPSLPDSFQPDWLQSLRQGGGEDELSVPEQVEQPDWSMDEGAEGEPEEAESESLPPPAEEAEATDWLDSLRPRSHGEREQPVLAEEPDLPSEEEQPEGEVPDWLQRVRSRQKAEEPETPPAEEDSGADEFLAGLRSKEPEQEKAPTEPLTPEQIQRGLEEEVEIPDWLADFTGSEAEAEPPGLPDWLKGQEFPPVSELPGQISPAQTSPAGQPQPEEGETPDWLAALEQSAGIEKEPGPAPEQEEAESKPEWLQEPKEPETPAPEGTSEADLKVVAPFTFDEESADLMGEEMPDWLKGVSQQEAPPESEAPQEKEEGLTPAELPTWLEAMRPVEAAAPGPPVSDERDRVIESSGPLAGLRGILPAEPEIARQKKLPAYSVKLQVSEAQQKHAAVLADLVKSEGIAPPVPRAPVISSQTVLRIAIFIIILASIAWPILSGSTGIPSPELTAEVADAHNLVNAIPDGGNVLLAVDYQPGFSGEMDAAAASMMDHLMIKGAYLTLVSTTTPGPAQAERLVRSVNQQMGHHYENINQYANLGYIAGGLTGLRSFAEAPKQIMPYALNDPEVTDIWRGNRLGKVKQISDFDLVVVITESPETAQNWIEQVGPKLGDSPLLMVVSAQAEPLVRPYYEGYPKQVQGLVVGLNGGAAYESTMPRTGIARNFWDAFSFGLPTAVLLILVGSLVNIVLAYLPARKKAEKEPTS